MEEKPAGTEVTVWVRTRRLANDWSDWKEIGRDGKITGSFDKLQYCVGLFTDDGQLHQVYGEFRLVRY